MFDYQTRYHVQNEKVHRHVILFQVETHSVSRAPTSSFHTSMENYDEKSEDIDVEKLRSELEQEIHTWSHPQTTSPEEVNILPEYIEAK